MTTTADGSTGPTAARRPGRPRTAERAARRAGLLDVAIRIFGARGYGATTIEAVASEAGVTKRTIYQHFTDKAGLFVAAVESQHAHEHTIAGEDLESLATRIVHTLHGDQAITLHRLVIAEALQFPDLAAAFYTHGPANSTEAIAHHLAVHLGAAQATRSTLRPARSPRRCTRSSSARRTGDACSASPRADRGAGARARPGRDPGRAGSSVPCALIRPACEVNRPVKDQDAVRATAARTWTMRRPAALEVSRRVTL